MKVLLFGGTGAMGGYLADILSSRGIETYVTTRQDRPQSDGIKYIKGNARDDMFVKSLLEKVEFDAIVDFMRYIPAGEFLGRPEFIASRTGHYIFLSSSRVYADSRTPITEDSPRLLDVCTDSEYLRTDEYALSKAREEDMLRHSGTKNWTIIRPYLTYSNERLQLGVYEKELWLWRALQGKPVIFSEDIAGKITTLTWGHDVAGGIAGLVGRSETFGQTFHITGDESMKWKDIAEIYREVFAQVTGHEMRIEYVLTALEMSAYVKYDRVYDRVFDNSRIRQLVPEFQPVGIREGLTRCLTEFVRDNHPFKWIDLRREARIDRITGSSWGFSWQKLSRMDKVKYFVWRYCPALEGVLKAEKRLCRL